MFNYIATELKKLQKAGLIRQFKTITAIRGTRVKIDNKWFISFCTNDYLGLAQHPACRQAAQKATQRFGIGSGASRLMAGTLTPHKELEKAIARFKHTPDALLFTSGYAANIGVLTTCITKNDIIFCDELNHASLVDASRLTTARLYIYKHRNVRHLEECLTRYKRQVRRNKKKLSRISDRPPQRGEARPTSLGGASRVFIVTDTIFSMDGDPAPLKEIIRLAHKYRATTIVDEAHGTGVLGKNGRGLVEHLSLEKKIDIIIGTFSKALGGVGGFVSGSQNLISYLRSKSRPFIFTTALPPGTCAANLAALKIMKTQLSLRRRLWRNTDYFKNKLQAMGFDLRGSVTPIIPVMIGDAKKTLKIADHLWKKGFFVPAIRPPTVPPGQSRLRISITAMHQKQDLDRLLEALREAF